MDEFESRWDALRSSPDQTVELERAEGLAAFARERGIRYRIALSDPSTGDQVPVTDLDKVQTVPIVHLQLEIASMESTWQPRSKESIYPLLRE